ncbi:UDP-glycosyltransferase UGT5-like [Periplaneta americana]|uniref:UDP-glycosyltransferase UGT5-like n=1 Tax=Periplaneta americana TaxID=6978 RepID=UPI0037E96BE4
MMQMLTLVLLSASILSMGTEAARILAMFPYNAKSHFFMFESLLLGLAERGHQVVVLGHFPQKNPIPNYTDISVDGTLPEIIDCVDINFSEDNDLFSLPKVLWMEQIDMCRLVLAHENVQKLLKSEDKFDLIISETFAADCFLGFVHKFKTPFINLISSVPFPWANKLVGNPDHPAYISNYFLPYTDKMSFKQRLVNTMFGLVINWMYRYYSDWPAYEIARQHFGDQLPPLQDIARNTSLILVNTHFSLNQPRPMVPAFVEVGGLHIRKAKKLPQDVEKYINESQHGVIYFSLGSMMRSETFHADKMKALLEAFRELPQRILWRCKGEIKNLPPNVKVSGWLPQRDILEHPNVRAFITHGGLMGTQEAAHAGVPMVGIPMFGDQFLNVDNYVAKGIAIKLNYHDITKEKALEVFRTILEDKRYQENSKKMSLLFRDRPQTSLETAIFWTEYVIRHGGAPHMRTEAVDMPWYQYLLLDVIIFILSATILVAFFIYFITKKVVHFVCSSRNVSVSEAKKRQ